MQRLSRDLMTEFPGQQGWSVTNFKDRRMVAQAWPTAEAIGPHGVDQLTWGHVRVLLDRLSTQENRDWYAARVAAEGWKRSVLEHFIKVGLKAQIGADEISRPQRQLQALSKRRRPKDPPGVGQSGLILQPVPSRWRCWVSLLGAGCG